jgi:hypothetical protein
MRSTFRLIAISVCLVFLFFGLNACKEKPKKEGKVEITENEYSIFKDGKFSYTLNVKGKIKNVGAVDLKNIVLTGYCRSCKETMISNTWYVTQVVKRPEQKANIGYLAIGATEDFNFDGIAYYYSQSSDEPHNLPEKLEVVVESFETVE